MKTTLDLPDELIREAKLRALMQGRTLRDLVAEFLREGLGLTSPKPQSVPLQKSMVTIDKKGFPVILGNSDAPSKKMTVEQALQLEQQCQYEEDMQRVGIPL